MNQCHACNYEMISEYNYDLQCTIMHCHHNCHWIMEYNDGKKVEEFDLNLISVQGYPITCLAQNTSEWIQFNGLKTRIKYCRVCFNGEELIVFDDLMIMTGSTSLPLGYTISI